MSNAMVQGPRRLVNNAFFPAAYVAIGHLSKIESKLPTISWADITNLEFSFKPKDIPNIFFEKLETFKDSFMSHNTTSAPTVQSGNFFANTYQSLSSSFSTLENHAYEIGTAAAIGATATIVNAILARTPGIKHWPKTRLVTAIALSTAGVMAGAKFGLGQDIDPQMILNIAIKVGIIGAGAKVAVLTTRTGFQIIRGSTNFISWGIQHTCNGLIFVANRLDWGSWPKGPAPSVPKKEMKKKPPPPLVQEKEQQSEDDEIARAKEELSSEDEDDDAAPVVELLPVARPADSQIPSESESESENDE
ncbi:MAG: hypothetical protein K1000chlam2_00289 [Chlamydiae bacterium]|nr:hypothetical protein [Chlamydiota bacterium]